ncbi:uncharacterized protein EAE97_008164 [Botrytis byssoidea]|uniref:Uncharacterized protein n=1 Tax=Botrytis byssoidea TaxID=139641 RepID=A0A9P5I959_9HELO|nr:uncharacterized protein EAE97_008164 [Botrytis byssoidea]KAF7935257.1 hypothetical protein EAE97_008164 [Botrytis byssoidea]
MANGVVKDKKLKRSLKDDNESRSVKRKTAHELQEIGDKRNDIGFFLINTAEGKLLLNILKEGNSMCLCTGCDRGSGEEADNIAVYEHSVLFNRPS